MIEEKEKKFRDIQTEYDRIFQTEPIRDDDRGYRWHARQLLKAKNNPRSILDLACGGGFFLKELLDSSAGGEIRTTGIDLSNEALELARKHCPSAQWILGVGEALPFRAGTFDAITCLGSLEHFLDVGEAIREMKRVSNPEAVFYILVPNLFWYKDLAAVLFTGGRKSRNQTHERFATLEEWKELLQNGGLRVERTLKYNGIAKASLKQRLKDLLIPLRFSYHFVFICSAA